MFGETPVEGYEVKGIELYRNLDLHAGEVVYVVELHVRNGNTLEEGHVYRYFVGHQDLRKFRDQIDDFL